MYKFVKNLTLNKETNIADMIKLPNKNNTILLTILAGLASFLAIIITYFSFKNPIQFKHKLDMYVNAR